MPCGKKRKKRKISTHKRKKDCVQIDIRKKENSLLKAFLKK